MKTTIDLDEAKLERVMKLTGLATRKEAVDFALSEVERAARVRAVIAAPFYDGVEEGPVVFPGYDLKALREREKPGRK